MKNSKSILLIEDDEDDQGFFLEAISAIENTRLYDIAKNGKEAINKLKNSALLPDIIFTDINMPIMDGIECFLEIIKNPRTKNIPVVFLSSDTGKRAIVTQLGAKGFIQKSHDNDTLIKQLAQMISINISTNNYIPSHRVQPVISI